MSNYLIHGESWYFDFVHIHEVDCKKCVELRFWNSYGRRSSLLIQNSKLQGFQLFVPRWIMMFWFCPYLWISLEKMCQNETIEFIFDEIQLSNPKLKTTGCPIIWATVNHDILIFFIFMNLTVKFLSKWDHKIHLGGDPAF